MPNQENTDMGAWANTPGLMNAAPNAPMGQTPYLPGAMPPTAAEAAVYQVIYPEVFYKLQPYIMMVCDEMDTYGAMMPTQATIERMTDGIYDDVCKMYPDLADYAAAQEKTQNDDPPDPPLGFGRGFGPGRGMFGRPFRRRGLFRDLIDILLLSEFFRRRRGY